MPLKIRTLILIGAIFALPFIAGCLGSGGANPVGDTSLLQGNSTTTTAQASVLQSQVLASKYQPANAKKYTYADPPYQVLHRIKEGICQRRGSLKIKIFSASKADHIFITLAEMKVKPIDGKPQVIPIEAREVDLLNAADISDVLADAELTPGFYNHMEFKIQSARVVIGDVSSPLIVPSQKVHFSGKFEIKEGYTTELAIKFIHKLIKVRSFGKPKYIFIPIIKLSFSLVAKPVEVTDGDISGTISDFVTKAPLSGITAALDGTSFSTTTDVAGGVFFTKVPAGNYNLKLTNANYLDKTFTVTVEAGKVAEITAEMNLAVIQSPVSNTGWFSEDYPLADAHGTYGEVAMEAPVTIDFVSLAFVKAEFVFDCEYHNGGGGRLRGYFSSTQQVQIIQNMGGWWVGNNAILGLALGDFYAANPVPNHYAVDVTDYVKNNPSSAYFFAAENLSTADIRLLNVQLSIYYR